MLPKPGLVSASELGLGMKHDLPTALLDLPAPKVTGQRHCWSRSLGSKEAAGEQLAIASNDFIAIQFAFSITICW